ncbi:reticulon-1-A-like isoform X11 [Ostrea edulis]|uniref:reticulon-1-A-like isoform X11 n=1 Tax=Ostrea edulis TaxID=37623 RepID=UPI0020950A72|nr:reticulon-1-A-like isoform X11 [Ostrea edulis]
MDPSIDESRDNAEEFETVDSIPEQDEEVTTTSFSGETVEADRYEPGYSSPAKTADAWLKNVDPRVGQKNDCSEKDEIHAESEGITEVTPNKVTLLELIYWRDVKKTGVVFGSMLFVLLSLSCFSVLSVLAYLSLAVLTVTLSFRIYKNVLQAVQKSGEGHPFKQFLEMNIDLPEDKAREAVVNILKHLNCTIRELRRLFLVEDLVDSIKFGLLLWVLTYVGSWFNGMTIIILDVIAIFTLPKVYETYKVQIDHYVDLARTHRDNMWKQVQAKVPFLKKKEKKL